MPSISISIVPSCCIIEKSKIHQIRDDKVVTLNFVNQLDDKDDELASQSFMPTNSRQLQMDLS